MNPNRSKLSGAVTARYHVLTESLRKQKLNDVSAARIPPSGVVESGGSLRCTPRPGACYSWTPIREVPTVERTNDHERAIAKTVDKKLVEYPGNHRYTIIGEVAESLDFVMSASDSQFLVSYVQLRRTQSISPSNSK